MESIFLVLALAVTVEALVEYCKSISKAFSDGQIKTAVTQLAAIAIACFLCIMTNADVYTYLSIQFSYPIVGCILTGIIASRGSNYVSDFIKKATAVNTNQKVQ